MTQPLDRSAIPGLGPIRGVDLPATEAFTLSNGIQAVVVRRTGVPMVGFEVLVRGGASTLAAGEAGLAALAADALDEGAGARDARELSEAVGAIGGRLATSAGYDAVRVRASAPSSRADELFALVSDVTVRPRLDTPDVDRVLALRRARVLQRMDDPSDLADDAFARVVYGDDPYGNPLIGSVETLATLDANDVRDYYAGHADPTRTTVFVVGDTERARIEALLEQDLGAWTADGPLRALPSVLPSTPATGAIHLVDKPGASQSEIRVGRMGVLPNDPDVAPVHVMNTLLGGSFTSRLNSKLREEKGFTYGAFSVFTNRVRTGPFSAETAVHTPVTAEAVSDILAEFERLQTETVPEEELERTKRYLALRLPARFETTAQVRAALSGLVLHGLTLDWYDDYVERIMAVRAADVRRVAKRALQLDEVAVVVAGDRSAIEGSLAALGRPVFVMEGGDTP